MSFRLLLATSTLLALLVPALQAEAQQGGRLLSATGTIAVRARVAARLEPTMVAVESVTADGRATTILTRVDVGANVPHQVRARVEGASATPVELRDVTGAWVRVAPGASVVVGSAASVGVTPHTFACRVSGKQPAGHCPVSLEIVSSDPEYPLQVSFASPAAR